MSRPQVTVRRLMILIALIALGMRAALAAGQAWNDQTWHPHIYVSAYPAPGITVAESRPAPFASRFWRRFLGRDWTWRYVCDPGDGPKESACSLDHPDVYDRVVIKGIDWARVAAIHEGRATRR